jgi:chorismate dehydratase
VPERIKIGGIGFVSAWPLVEGLASEAGVDLRLEAPSALAPLLKAGEVDAALVPSIDYYRLAADSGERARAPAGRAPSRFVALDVAAIGSRGPVGSARLFGYAEAETIRRVLLDPASRTESVMARLLLARPAPVQPHFVLPEEIGPHPARPPDAELVVGDAALGAARPAAQWEWDLGEEWEGRVHRPFVYAFWVARSDGPLGRLVEVLSAARDRGLAAREAIAARAAAERGIPPAAARRHLCHQVEYGFGPKARLGLTRFYEMAAEEGLAPEGCRLALAPGAAGP